MPPPQLDTARSWRGLGPTFFDRRLVPDPLSRHRREPGTEPLHHFVHHGAAECRDPNRLFDSAWYFAHYPDVANSGHHPLLHYLQTGAAELRNPHPRFDATYYVDQHPEAATNPLTVPILRFGSARGWLTERPVAITDYLPADASPPAAPHAIVVDVVIPAYRGLLQTQRCDKQSVLADPDRPAGRVIVVDDRSPDPKLSAWLGRLATGGHIELLRNRRNQGFVASVNIGMKAAGDHDIVLLNSDTEVPEGWLARLTGHAYARERIGIVSPFSNNATICSYPSWKPGLPPSASARPTGCDLPVANAGRTVELPTVVGFCMYIRRPRWKSRSLRRRYFWSRLWRGKRLLPACRRTGLASPACLRHLRLS